MKKSKTILFVILLAVNLLLVQIFKIKITFQQVLIIQIFLFSLSFLADIIQLKFSKNKNITPAHFLMINFLIAIKLSLVVNIKIPLLISSENDSNILYE